MKKLALLLLILFSFVSAQKSDTLKSATFAGLKFRSIGPSVIGGRIVSFAVHPENRSIYYVGVGSSGVWKTTNAGTTWDCVFENEGSFSIGSVMLNPSNPHEVWVGTKLTWSFSRILSISPLT